MLSDVDGRVIRLYGVKKDEGIGAKRSVFVLGKDLRILHANTAFNASEPSHYVAILQALRADRAAV